jgi:hypothetical protein
MFKSNLSFNEQTIKGTNSGKTKKNMAKVIAPFLIKGTIDDINFCGNGKRELCPHERKTGVTAEEFKIILFTTEFAIKEKIWTVRKKSGF